MNVDRLKSFFALAIVATFAFTGVTLANDAEEAQRQGLTLQEYRALKGKRWNTGVSTGYFRGVDELAEGFISTGLDISYKYNLDWIVGSSLSYTVPSDFDDVFPETAQRLHHARALQ